MNKVKDYHLNAQNFSTDFVLLMQKVRSSGAEAELQWRPTEALLIHANAGYSDARFEDYDDALQELIAGNSAFHPRIHRQRGFARTAWRFFCGLFHSWDEGYLL